MGEYLTEPVQAETVEKAVPQADPQEEGNTPVVQEDPQAEEPPADIVIDSNTTWSEARTLTGDLTVNPRVTLTIGAQVMVIGDVTISGGGTSVPRAIRAMWPITRKMRRTKRATSWTPPPRRRTCSM